MTKPAPLIPLREVLKPISRPETVDPEKTYRILGTRWYAGGLFVKDIKPGSGIQATKVYRVEKDDFVYNRLFAWKGSFALATGNDDGCWVSNEFPCFTVNHERADGRYLQHYFSRAAAWTEALGLSTGGTPTSRNRLKEEKFLAMKIPLPPLPEQRRIVARIEELAARIHEARALRQEAADEAEALVSSTLSQACCGRPRPNFDDEVRSRGSARELLERVSRIDWPGQVEARKRKPMTLPTPPEIPESWLVIEAGRLQECGAILDIQDGNHGGDYPRKAEFGDEGVPFVTAKQIDRGTVRIAEAPRLPPERAAGLRIGFAKAGDVLLTHNASVGDVAIAPDDAADFLLGTSVTYWRCNPEALDRRFLCYFMRSEHFQGQLQFIMKQTTRNQVSVQKQVSLWICFPPLPEQRRIVAELDALQAQVDALKRLQAETAAELDALLPSILDRAFRREL